MSFLSTVVPAVPSGGFFDSTWIDAIGYVGNFCWFMRFFQQWIASEKKKENVFPIMFWYWSLLGTVFLGTSFILSGNKPGMIAYVPNAFIYVRNLQFAHRKRRQLLLAGNAPAAPNEEPKAEVPAGSSGKSGKA